MSSLPLRSSLDKSYTWNAESVFATPEGWWGALAIRATCR